LNIKNIKGATIKCSDCSYDYDQNKCLKSGIDCPTYCRPHFYEGECYDCSTVFKDDTSQLYSINVDSKKCQGKIKYTTGDDLSYITSETNENIYDSIFTSKVNAVNPQFFIFGNFIYNKQCPTDAKKKEANSYLCICETSKYAYLDNIFGRPWKKCVDSCPNGYYYYKDGENICIKEYKSDEGYNLITTSNNKCVMQCPYDHPYYYELNGKKYCSKKCPSNAPFYYSDNTNYNGIKCIEKCNDRDFYLSDTKECLHNSNCGANYKLYIDFDNSIFLCYKQTGATTQCPDDFPYKYGNLCLRKCSDTRKSLYSGFVIKTTYTHITSSEKKCVISCNESDNTNKYYDEETLECINDCTTTSKKYKFGNKCVKSCDTTANKFHNYGQYDCINECDYSSSFKYKSNEDNICYDDCKNLSPIFYYDKDKKLCFSKCDKYILKKKEGSNEILYCLNQCSDGNSLPGEPSSTSLVHRYNDKICLESCKVNDNDNSPYYHINSNQVCYQSCKDVNNNNIYEYNSLCYTTIDDDLYEKKYRVEWYMLPDEAKSHNIVTDIIGQDVSLAEILGK
jgi:hypothetical protein